MCVCVCVYIYIAIYICMNIYNISMHIYTFFFIFCIFLAFLGIQMAQPGSATMKILLAVSDNPDPKKVIFKMYTFKKENEDSWTFETLLSDAIDTRMFPEACLDQGLLMNDAIHLRGKDFDGESLTLSVTDSNSFLSDYFQLFVSIHQIIFRLNLKVKALPTIEEATAHQQKRKMFPMFSESKKNSLSDNTDQQGLPKKLRVSSDNETPMTRQVFRLNSGITLETPNIDYSWDIFCNWLVNDCGFGCSIGVKKCLGHLMYKFIDNFCLLLSQVCFFPLYI
jgi:hypothetical protein